VYPLALFSRNKTSIFSKLFSKNSENIKFYENPSSGNRAVPCGQTDEGKNMTTLIVAVQNFVNSPKTTGKWRRKWGGGGAGPEREGNLPPVFAAGNRKSFLPKVLWKQSDVCCRRCLFLRVVLRKGETALLSPQQPSSIVFYRSICRWAVPNIIQLHFSGCINIMADLHLISTVFYNRYKWLCLLDRASS